MAKNRMAESMRPILEKITVKIYCAFTIALAEEYGWSEEQIHEICEYSQALWMQATDKNIDMIKWCKDRTGIDMGSRVHE